MGIKIPFIIVLNILSSFNQQVFLIASAEIIIRDESPVVSLLNGKQLLQGKWQTSRNISRVFASFEGIPYAKAARFQPPEVALDWEGILDASVPRNVCPQKNAAIGISFLEEFCLFANIHVPQVNSSESLPVMVWIHGGGYTTGAGSYYGPRYLMEQDIILVTINYRLGALGFLNTEDGVVEGNIGLKDQIMALKWVKKNIGAFGGDPENLTIFGESAGGMSVHMLMISPSAKGLFNKVISQSGTGLCSQCFNSSPKEAAANLAKELECAVTNSTLMIDCIKKKSVQDILDAQEKFTMVFVPTVDTNASDFSVLPDTPRNLVEQPLKDGSNVLPFIVGWNQKEMILAAAEIFATPALLQSLNKNWNETLPTLLNYKSRVDSKDLNRVSTDIRNFYLKNTPVITNASFEALSNLFTDYFIVDILMTALLQSEYNTQVYPFELTYRGNYSKANQFGIKGEGPCHTDELQYLFQGLREPNKNWPDLIQGSEDENFSRNMIELWTSFAYTGKPEASEWEEEWLPVSPVSKNDSNKKVPRLRWYNLNLDSKLVMENPEVAKRIEFWENVFTDSKNASNSVFDQFFLFSFSATLLVVLLTSIICN